jgi:hypothetical protein
MANYMNPRDTARKVAILLIALGKNTQQDFKQLSEEEIVR